MQRIMIVSDTHKRLGNLYEALEREGHIDAMIHLGDLEGDEEIIDEMIDGKVFMVPGNNDYYSQASREIEMQLAGKNILLTHGHYYYVSLDLQMIRSEAIARGMDIVMFGHTHRPVIQVEDEITLINPGSISYPRQQDGKCTYIMLEISEDGTFSFELKCV